MKSVNYRQGTVVSKAIAGGNWTGKRIVERSKVGVTLSPTPYKLPSSSAWYVDVKWDKSQKPERVALNVLVDHQLGEVA